MKKYVEKKKERKIEGEMDYIELNSKMFKK
jgi:hypothetical protein